MYRYEPNIPKRKWYQDVLIILAIAATLWLLLLARGVATSLISNETALAAVDVLTLLIAGVAAYITFTKFCTRYVYILEGNTLTLQATRGHRVIRQITADISAITAAECTVKRSNAYCYSGSKATVFKYGEDAFSFCPDQRLFEAVFNKNV